MSCMMQCATANPARNSPLTIPPPCQSAAKMMIAPIGLGSRALPCQRRHALRPAAGNFAPRRVQAASTVVEEAPAETQLASALHPHPVLSAVSGTRAWATQLWTGIRKGDGSSAASDVLDKASLVVDTAERAQEVHGWLCSCWAAVCPKPCSL